RVDVVQRKCTKGLMQLVYVTAASSRLMLLGKDYSDAEAEEDPFQRTHKWRLVKEKFGSPLPNVDKEKALWVELKRLFKPDADDMLWKLQRYMHYPIT
nr:hypothetical protein [Tanacetum cinerariifolium]